MIVISPIPLDLDPERLSRESGLSSGEARDFLALAGPRLSPRAAFEEIDPAEMAEALPEGRAFWGDAAIVAMCSLGVEGGLPADNRWEHLASMALKDVVDFLEYRIRKYLTPTGRAPGARMIPGCRELPAEAASALIGFFGPEYAYDLDSETGRSDGLLLVYPTAERAEDARSGCAGCNKDNCPLRS